MKSFVLDQKRHYSWLSGENVFNAKDLDQSIRSCTPGEWVEFEIGNFKTIGFVNPFIEDFGNVTILKTTEREPLKYIEKAIKSAHRKRSILAYHGERLIYGFSDGLPGLVVDTYESCSLVQISSAGLDRFRNEIKEIIKQETGKEVIFLDNKKYREKEGLPFFENDQLPDVIDIRDLGIEYQLKKDVLQKVGYYYDHRENRLKLENTLKRINKEFTNGLDLFCYIGSWGMHMLRAGVKNVEFVDQGNMNDIVLKNIELNSFEGNNKFVRDDVFAFLDSKIKEKARYDVIVCDPPSFTKSVKNKNSALSGYEKLYQKSFQLLNSESILVAASCTQYITIEELDKVVVKSALREGKKVQVLDIGLSSWDHPISSLSSKSNYIKYICYFVE
ncbi:class I SAM-dependent rRNA methyltransferase [Bacteriovorax sp. Seq25_V]|uniref:class I SAM-dependent rRNA methyltransferase n=1 Tax=Bacteriovorax sp. Seq25_V TaxID=1201288 RepID=UPI00038A4276|nr:class I SAM-dependent methyltransferase [Bacteriovorax sp. Seq25_V]EQC43268.1 S-adenosylmethionine-dependent methyltransferase [Bacteriovorax sp. Seq25_V]